LKAHFTKVFKGQEKLWVVFWFYTVIGNILTLFIGASPFLLGLVSMPFILLTVAISVLYSLFSIYILWQNAFNTNWKILGFLTRAITVLYLLFVLSKLFVNVSPA
jgi:hypothetical protein